jgi:1,4-dihydroxy-2-naphthoate octaprenyltransferase
VRERLGLTIFFGVAAVLAAVAALAGDSAWAVLAAAVVVLFAATTLVVGASLASMEEGKDLSRPLTRLRQRRR